MGTHSQVCRTALHAPLLPNPKELVAPNLAGPCLTCLRPFSVDKEFKFPRKSATVAPAPTQGAPQDRTQTGPAISPFPQTRQTAGVRHPAAPSLSKTPPWRDPRRPSRNRRTACTAEGGRGAGPRDAPHRATSGTAGWGSARNPGDVISAWSPSPRGSEGVESELEQKGPGGSPQEKGGEKSGEQLPVQVGGPGVCPKRRQWR